MTLYQGIGRATARMHAWKDKGHYVSSVVGATLFSEHKNALHCMLGQFSHEARVMAWLVKRRTVEHAEIVVPQEEPQRAPKRAGCFSC